MQNLLNMDPTVLIQGIGILGVFFIIFAETGLLIGFFLPGDSLLIPIGILAAQGDINVWTFALIVTIAAIAGDSVGYLIGRRLGSKVFIKENSYFFDKKHVVRTERFYKKYGPATVLLARFVPIVRTIAPTMAGVGRMPYGTFIKWNIVGGILWPVALIGIGYFFGNLIPNVDKYIIPSILAIVVIFALPVIFHALKKIFTRKKEVSDLT